MLKKQKKNFCNFFLFRRGKCVQKSVHPCHLIKKDNKMSSSSFLYLLEICSNKKVTNSSCVVLIACIFYMYSFFTENFISFAVVLTKKTHFQKQKNIETPPTIGIMQNMQKNDIKLKFRLKMKLLYQFLY